MTITCSAELLAKEKVDLGQFGVRHLGIQAPLYPKLSQDLSFIKIRIPSHLPIATDDPDTLKQTRFTANRLRHQHRRLILCFSHFNQPFRRQLIATEGNAESRPQAAAKLTYKSQF
jgi:hypothetical protein